MKKKKEKEKTASMNNTPLRILFLCFVIACSFIAVTAASGIKKRLIGGERINILLLGISEIDNARFAEVIKIISYEPITGFTDIVSIPRDTMISVPYKVTWKRIQKLDELYSRYFRKCRETDRLIETFKRKVEKFLDDQISIDYYVQIDYNAFVDFIDTLGGVKVEVNDRLDYDDEAQDLHIHISTGINRMNGEESLKYVRYRDKVMGDIGRQERQHLFIRALMERLQAHASIPRIPALIKSIAKNIETNLSVYDLVVIADELRGIDIENFRVQTLPGEPVVKWGKSYWAAKKKGVREVLDVVTNSHLISLPSVDVNRSLKMSQRITAEVWNATTRASLARNLTEYLRKRNVDVVRYGNFGSAKKYTQIISRTGDLKPAREVAKIIGCRNINTELDSSRMVDINIVIGDDFETLWRE
ncbi:MAG: LCP family protein [Elusimicrobiota bacterium]